MLEQGGTFSGINRKVQLKPTKWSRRPQQPTDPGQQQDAMSADPAPQQQGDSKAASDSNARSSSTGGSKVDKDKISGDDEPVVTELLLILKYGGVLTHAGRAQAEELGKMFRMVMYPR